MDERLLARWKGMIILTRVELYRPCGLNFNGLESKTSL
jgi:hypothetical protein